MNSIWYYLLHGQEDRRRSKHSFYFSNCFNGSLYVLFLHYVQVNLNRAINHKALERLPSIVLSVKPIVCVDYLSCTIDLGCRRSWTSVSVISLDFSMTVALGWQGTVCSERHDWICFYLLWVSSTPLSIEKFPWKFKFIF